MRSVRLVSLLTLLSAACSLHIEPGSATQANTGPSAGQPIHVSSSGLASGTQIDFTLSGANAANAHLVSNGSTVTSAHLDSHGEASLTLIASQPGDVVVNGKAASLGGPSAHSATITFVGGGGGGCGTLPAISTFQTTPSDRFLVDPSIVTVGHPYKGARLANVNDQHQGAHVQFDNSSNTWPQGGTAPSNYPAVYAVADGRIGSIDTYFPVGANYRYGVNLAFATSGGVDVNFGYSLEPMTNPNDANFYVPFIHVTAGQCVHKGDVIAHLYVPPNAGIGTHIHFDLQAANNGGPNSFMAPAIFTPQVVSDFAAHWSNFGLLLDGTQIPTTMGYMLQTWENPFGTGAVDCLDPQNGACP